LSAFEYGWPDLARWCFVCPRRTRGVAAEPAYELLMKHRGDLADALSVPDSRNDRSDLGTVFVRRRAAFEQPIGSASLIARSTAVARAL
jgi:hypothetical protein